MDLLPISEPPLTVRCEAHLLSVIGVGVMVVVG